MNEQKETIKTIISELLNKMDVAFDEIEVSEEEDRTKFIIRTKESGLLIGSHGEHFSALSHVLKRMAEKKNQTKSQFSIDVNNYHEKILDGIKSKALVIAERVRSFKTTMELEPMSPYERMIVHSLFTDAKDIETHSLGFGDSRRVVIKYVEREKEEEPY